MIILFNLPLIVLKKSWRTNNMAKKTYLIIDLWNLLNRAKFVSGKDMDTAVGMCLHLAINSIRFSAKKYGADHVIIAAEGRSWRKDKDPKYKANRVEKIGVGCSRYCLAICL